MELNDNKLKDEDLVELLKYKKLIVLKLGGNHIKTFEALEKLKSLELESLDLVGNPVCDKQDYKDKMFAMFPKLVGLDGFDKEGNELESDLDDDEDAEIAIEDLMFLGEAGEDEMDEMGEEEVPESEENHEPAKKRKRD